VLTKYTFEEAWRLYIHAMQIVDLSHPLASPFNVPINSTSYGDQQGTPQIQEDVSWFYPPAADLHQNMPMDGGVRYAYTNNSTGYLKQSYTAHGTSHTQLQKFGN
jgi:hypothetical protein